MSLEAFSENKTTSKSATLPAATLQVNSLGVFGMDLPIDCTQKTPSPSPTFFTFFRHLTFFFALSFFSALPFFIIAS
jgi:hypothetical protein